MNVFGVYNEIFNALMDRFDFKIPVNFNRRASEIENPANAAGAEPLTNEAGEAFGEILLNYLNGDRSDETLSSAIEAAIKTTSNKYGVDENLIRAVIKAESGYNPNAVSHAGAAGLMQLMPSTANSLGVADIYNVYQNIEGGTKFLSDMLEKFSGDESLALAAYNAGPGNVAKFGGIPPFEETQNHIPKVLSYKEQYMLEQYKQAGGGKSI